MAAARLAEADEVFAAKIRHVQRRQYFKFEPIADIVTRHDAALFVPPCADDKFIAVRRAAPAVDRAIWRAVAMLVQNARHQSPNLNRLSAMAMLVRQNLASTIVIGE